MPTVEGPPAAQPAESSREDSHPQREAKTAKQPEYDVEYVPMTDDAPACVRVRVNLPAVAKGSELDLHVGDTALELKAESGPYRLALDLGHVVDPDSCHSRWDKKTRVLVVECPVARCS
mmetsp:Transcript_10702/g.25873  ORF Transcript_10702/g.25873 Transcript_10702/m.25873 type:complete len:119 (+) Transcript_10702:1-357(+)